MYDSVYVKASLTTWQRHGLSNAIRPGTRNARTVTMACFRSAVAYGQVNFEEMTEKYSAVSWAR